MYCSAYGCRSKGTNDRKVSFHRFPRPGQKTPVMNMSGMVVLTERRSEWQRVLQITRPISARMVICSRHFKKSDYIHPGEQLDWIAMS